MHEHNKNITERINEYEQYFCSSDQKRGTKKDSDKDRHSQDKRNAQREVEKFYKTDIKNRSEILRINTPAASPEILNDMDKLADEGMLVSCG